MGKWFIDPPMKMIVPAYEISDQTAAIKARRLMDEVLNYATPDNLDKSLEDMGMSSDRSGTRRWKILLTLPARRRDLLGVWLDGKGRSMERPDPKKTRTLLLIMLVSSDLVSVREGSGKLFLSSILFERNQILRAYTSGIKAGKTSAMLTVTLHALQRMIQRGAALTDNGELSYVDLLNHLTNVFVLAQKRFLADKTLLEHRIEFAGGTFVVRAGESGQGKSELTLVTMLPPKN
ncbi:hypothetical protein [Marinobacter sp. F3R08]|uniref:hypothetical protein n=1 Tax=Marinobacter sp. F3R08 TaxID=2841559 RepID=UPI001C09D1FA|nr:hypothetical protein [Marinobacter sp. F3R08]MBU2952177.1 hypothetical protein [Marinobacter sp. F3R08]